jgi:hypothetical protein
MLTISEAREKLEKFDIVEAYHDYHEGDLERIKNDVYQLQRAVTALVALLVAQQTIDINEYTNEV